MFFTIPRHGSAIKNIRIYRDLDHVLESKYKNYKSTHKQWQDQNPFSQFLDLWGNDVWFGSDNAPPRKLSKKEVYAMAEAKGYI